MVVLAGGRFVAEIDEKFLGVFAEIWLKLELSLLRSVGKNVEYLRLLSSGSLETFVSFFNGFLLFFLELRIGMSGLWVSQMASTGSPHSEIYSFAAFTFFCWNVVSCLNHSTWVGSASWSWYSGVLNPTALDDSWVALTGSLDDSACKMLFISEISDGSNCHFHILLCLKSLSFLFFLLKFL